MTTIDEAAATLGHNNPPMSPFEESQAEIEGLYDEAKGWLDGEPVDNQKLADGISELNNLIRAARKKADEARKTENKPFDEGKSEVQARYNPLLKKADMASDACKEANKPWLEKMAAEKEAAAVLARQEAEAKAQAAQEAMQASTDNLEEREKAEALLKAAKDADKRASRAAKDTAKASGGTGRAMSLRTSYEPALINPEEAARWYWKTKRDAMNNFLISLAKTDVSEGKREIPGFEIIENKTAV